METIIQELQRLQKDHFPYFIDFKKQMNHIINVGLLKTMKSKLEQTKLINIINEEVNLHLIKNLFWSILMKKFPQATIRKDLVKYIQQKIGALFFQVFTLIQSPKEDVSNTLIFFNTYVCHTLYYQHFNKDINIFDLRFIFDCYTHTILLVNGIEVSDYFVQINLERIFTNQFFNFQEQGPIEFKKKELQFSQLFSINKTESSDRVFHINTDVIQHITEPKPMNIRKFVRDQRAISEASNSQLRKKLNFNQVSPPLQMITQLNSKAPAVLKKYIFDDSTLVSLMNEYKNYHEEQKKDFVTKKKTKHSPYQAYNMEPRSLIEDTNLQKNFMKEMKDHNYILNKTQDTMQNLPSARKVLCTEYEFVPRSQEKHVFKILHRKSTNNVKLSSAVKLQPYIDIQK